MNSPHNAANILLVEDEPAIADTLIYALETEGFGVRWTRLAADALQLLFKPEAGEPPVDLLVLDVGLPDMSGFELCKRIRLRSEVPIVFLTARKDEIDRIVGLEIGGDDYVTKPFSPREVCARVRAILKRLPARATAEPCAVSGVTISGFELDEEKARITFRKTTLTLTRYEYLLLCHLLHNPERVFSRAQLMDKVWSEPEASFERAVDTHIKSIRAKLRDISPNENPIVTHRGLGYSLAT